ncbi:HIT family protein [Streptomyces sp. NPDC058231]|uniref:HIT family protein n=1 Tax=Streptomyces sp. NPDC058231 TaxID=3346392 RepID=UPI0036E858CC
MAQSYLWRSGQVRGYAVVIFTARHVAEPTEMSEREATAFWRDARAVGRTIEEHYQPVLKMNYLLLGNAIPHAHWHLVPSREATKDPAPGGPVPFALLDHGRQDEALLQRDAAALRRLLRGAA